MERRTPSSSTCARPGCGRSIYLVQGRWVHQAEEPADRHEATTRRPELRISYGPSGDTIECTGCGKRARMVPAAGDTVKAADVARYRREHVCGTPDSGWDVEDRDDAEEPAR